MDKAEFHAQLSAIADDIPLHVLEKLYVLLDEYAEALMDIEGSLIEVSKQMGALAVVVAMEDTIRAKL